jgi:hypothetical protein
MGLCWGEGPQIGVQEFRSSGVQEFEERAPHAITRRAATPLGLRLINRIQVFRTLPESSRADGPRPTFFRVAVNGKDGKLAAVRCLQGFSKSAEISSICVR